ncbi:hypothetical protein L2E82_16536 [Cichorium intybus]|uniref:Uncharacterized protein n=1 Tax=Cichorium intybus TaxID=13427 RepID=A0ACB9F6E2_CICIN|nr:hypothetical protein L2E82_16536 [Cichorium intybus]
MLLTCIAGHQSLYIVIVTVTVFYIYFSRRDKMILHLVFGVVIVGFFCYVVSKNRILKSILLFLNFVT